MMNEWNHSENKTCLLQLGLWNYDLIIIQMERRLRFEGYQRLISIFYYLLLLCLSAVPSLCDLWWCVPIRGRFPNLYFSLSSSFRSQGSLFSSPFSLSFHLSLIIDRLLSITTSTWIQTRLFCMADKSSVWMWIFAARAPEKEVSGVDDYVQRLVWAVVA